MAKILIIVFNTKKKQRKNQYALNKWCAWIILSVYSVMCVKCWPLCLAINHKKIPSFPFGWKKIDATFFWGTVQTIHCTNRRYKYLKLQNNTLNGKCCISISDKHIYIFCHQFDALSGFWPLNDWLSSLSMEERMVWT